MKLIIYIFVMTSGPRIKTFDWRIPNNRNGEGETKATDIFMALTGIDRLGHLGIV